MVHIYQFQEDPAKITDTAMGMLHAVIGVCLAFFIMYRGFYGAVLGGACWLFYKILEAAFLVICLFKSVLLSSEFLFENSWDSNFVQFRKISKIRHDFSLFGFFRGLFRNSGVCLKSNLLDTYVV